MSNKTYTNKEKPAGKLVSLTLVEKLDLINKVEAGRSIKDVSEHYAVNKNTLHYIVKNKNRIREGINNSPGLADFKRIKQIKSPELEQRVIQFMLESRANNQNLSGSIIKTVALEFAAELGVDNFAGSNGWLHSFFKRHQININDYKSLLERKTSKEKSHDVNHLEIQNEFEEVNNDGSEMCEILETEEHLEESSSDFLEIHGIEEEEYDELITEGDETGTSFKIDDRLKTADNSKQILNVHILAPDLNHNNEDYETIWFKWCRFCGKRETKSDLESYHVDVVCILLNITPNDVRICDECKESTEKIHNMIQNGLVVQKMLSEIDELQKKEVLCEEKVEEIRREFGFENEDMFCPNISTEISNQRDFRNDIAQESNREEPEELEQQQDEEIYEEIVEVFETSTELIKSELDLPSKYEPQIEAQETIQSTTHQTIKSLERLPDDENYEYRCHICGLTFERMCFLSNHTRTLHQCMPKVACNDCGRFVRTWESLMAHKRKHSPEENHFKCDMCNARFRTKSGLLIHIKFKHKKPAEIFECQTCGVVLKERTSLKIHLRTHLPDSERLTFECKLCWKKFSTRFSLKYHTNRIHMNIKIGSCELCGKSFKSSSNLRSHLICHSTNYVPCELCGKTFKNLISLQSHIRKHNAKLKVICKICNKAFRSRHNLLRHEISHSDDRRFKCPIASCPNEYKWQKDLNNHLMKTHKGETPYKCPFCEKSFLDPSHVKRHKIKDHPEIPSDQMEVSFELEVQ